MKLIDQYIDPTEAAEAGSRLRQAGIACIVDSMDPHSILPSRSGATHIGLWTLADDQYEDALQLLEDPAHVPRKSLSADEVNGLEAAARSKSRKRRLADKALAALLFACLVGLIGFTVADFFLDL